MSASLMSNVTESHIHIKVETAHASMELKYDRSEEGYDEAELVIFSIPEFLQAVEQRPTSGDVIKLDGGPSLLVVSSEMEDNR